MPACDHRPSAAAPLLVLGAGLLAACPSKHPDCPSAEERTVRACEGAPADLPPAASPYPLHSNIVASVFWVGEGETAENDFIQNHASAWDPKWEEHFGGVDAPEHRYLGCPCFAPKENPYYVALPYNDLDEAHERRPEAAKVIPWFEMALSNVEEGQSVLKNRWVEVSIGARRCYGQWEDVGPALEDDVDYVFGSAAPRNGFGLKAGIDLSPALASCLGIQGTANVTWRFVDPANVPAGPWSHVVTLRR